MPKKEFAEDAVPSFDRAPSVVAVVGPVDFFVEEAAIRARGRLAEGDVEVLRFDDDAPPGAVAEALLNRPLFSAKRLVEIDVSRLLGTDSPGNLAEEALDAWTRKTPAGRRDAFRRMRRVLSALDVSIEGDPAEAASVVARKLRRKELAEPLAEILREMPEERAATGATLASTLRLLLSRPNDGLVALLTASDPPAGSELLAEVAKRGLLLAVRVDEDRKEIEKALRRLAAARARERDVGIDAEAVSRLIFRTNAEPGIFATELEKLLDWAGDGGRIRAADVGEQVFDEASEDFYEFLEMVGKREAGEALKRLERLFSGREVRAPRRVFLPDPGVVDQHVEPAPRGDDVADDLARLVGVRDVSGESERFPSGRAGLADELLGAGVVGPVVDGDARPRAGQKLRGRATDSARGAGDERDARREVDRDGQDGGYLMGRPPVSCWRSDRPRTRSRSREGAPRF